MNIEIPPGYGIRPLSKDIWGGTDFTDPRSCEVALMDKLLIWEPPRPHHHYIVGVDVSDGLGMDRSVIDVMRAPTISEPAEQVAQFVTEKIEPVALAYVIDPIGRFYRDDDENEALLAIETNNHGLGTQAELQGHLGYSNFYVWQKFDIRNPARRFSSSFGWSTNRRTRPMMIDFFRNALENVDQLTGTGDVILNSPFTISELRDFQAPAGMPAFMAEAAPGAHDDCLFAAMIALYVCHIERFTEDEPINEKRRRLNEQKLRKDFVEEITGMRRSAQNTAVPADGSIYDDWEEQDVEKEW